jgi:hypothetical protein
VNLRPEVLAGLPGAPASAVGEQMGFEPQTAVSHASSQPSAISDQLGNSAPRQG